VTLIERASAHFRELQDTIVAALERLDGQGRFREDTWTRPAGGSGGRGGDAGGGRTRVLEGGSLFERAGVNWSDVAGELPEELSEKTPGEGREFRATGISLVLHPRSPMVPTVHANFRCLTKGKASWFGGGSDLTPYYFHREDAVHFHRTWKEVCDRHDPTWYPRFKKWCDDYFYLPHRGETRGVGGIFFDYLQGEGLEHVFAFVRDGGEAFLRAYAPIVERRRGEPYGEREREFQLLRRGRYVEFNLIHDRGTTFGLKTGGRTESILMSLPPLVAWKYDFHPAEGSREAEMLRALRPTDWLGAGGAGATTA
jgi:coproporphyrinogen III oxidase